MLDLSAQTQTQTQTPVETTPPPPPPPIQARVGGGEKRGRREVDTMTRERQTPGSELVDAVARVLGGGVDVGDTDYLPFSHPVRKAIREIYNKSKLYPDQTLLQYLERLNKIEPTALNLEARERALAEKEFNVKQQLANVKRLKQRDSGGVPGIVASEDPHPTDTSWDKWYNENRSGSETRKQFRDRINNFPVPELERLLFVNTGERISAYSNGAKRKITEWSTMSPSIDTLVDTLALRDKNIKKASTMLRDYQQRKSNLAFPTSAPGDPVDENERMEEEGAEEGSEESAGESAEESAALVQQLSLALGGMTLGGPDVPTPVTAAEQKSDKVAALREHLATAKEQIERLDNQIAAYKTETKELRTNLQEFVPIRIHNRVLSELKTTKTDLKEKQSELGNTQKMLESERDQMKKMRLARQTEEAGPISQSERDELDSLRDSLTFQIKRAESAEKELSKIGDEIAKLRDENTEARDKNAIVTTKLLDASMGMGPEVRNMASRMKAVYRELLSEKRISVCSPRFEFQVGKSHKKAMSVDDLTQLGVYDVTMLDVEIRAMDIDGVSRTVRGNSGTNDKYLIAMFDSNTQFPTGSHILVKLSVGVEEEVDFNDRVFNSEEEKGEAVAEAAKNNVKSFIPRYETDLVSLAWTTFQPSIGKDDLASRSFTTTHPLVFRSIELNQAFRADVVVTVDLVDKATDNVWVVKKDFISNVFIANNFVR